jgi:hypothetical protein
MSRVVLAASSSLSQFRVSSFAFPSPNVPTFPFRRNALAPGVNYPRRRRRHGPRVSATNP